MSSPPGSDPPAGWPEAAERTRIEAIRSELLPFEALEETFAGNGGPALAATRILDFDHPGPRRAVAEALAGEEDEVARFRSLFDFVRDRITYEFAPLIHGRDDFRASRVLADGKGFCTQKALLLATLARGAGVPAVVGFQRLRDHKLLGRFERFVPGGEITLHGFNAVRLRGKWVRVDATLDDALCRRRGYRRVEVDAVEDRLLPPTDLEGRPHFDILENYGFAADLPEAVSDFVWWWLHEKHPPDEWSRFVHRFDLTM